jgi:FemAB-related protein (PEP-CTERM system-associated)
MAPTPMTHTAKIDVQDWSESPQSAQAWEAFVERHPETTNDHRWGWRRVLSESFGFEPHYLAAVQGGEVVGILPLFRIPRGLGRCALVSIPFANYGGICADSPEAAAALLAQAKRLTTQLRALYLALHHVQPLQIDGLQPHALYSRFTYPITGDAQQMWKGLHHNSRNNIKKAQSQGLQLEASRDASALYEIHTRTVHRLGTPCFPRRYFELILECFGPRAEIFYVLHQGRRIAYDFMVYHKQSIICQFNGSLSEFFQLKPNNILFWHALKSGCERGFRELDYCRSRKDSGPAEFKRRLKFVEVPLGYQYHLPTGRAVPEHNPSNPKYRLLIQAWQRLPLAMTTVLGPRLVRYLA